MGSRFGGVALENRGPGVPGHVGAKRRRERRAGTCEKLVGQALERLEVLHDARQLARQLGGLFGSHLERREARHVRHEGRVDSHRGSIATGPLLDAVRASP